MTPLTFAAQALCIALLVAFLWALPTLLRDALTRPAAETEELA